MLLFTFWNHRLNDKEVLRLVEDRTENQHLGVFSTSPPNSVLPV